jgi:hypothetical protein
MNVALCELRSFTCLPGREIGDHHASDIIIAPTLTYMDRAYHDAREFGWSRKPTVEVLGDVTGAPGQNAAQTLLSCVRKSRWRAVAF